MHVAADYHLLFSNHRDVVLRLACHNAIVAADAGIQINGHAPYVRFFLVGIRLVQRQFSRRLFVFSELGFLAVLFQTRGAYLRPRALWSVHGLVTLSRRELVGATRLGDIHTRCEPWRRT